jgi:aspartyl-tRNA(Asn)/glutamyl-tRNA(Gln) amidotransferase subunit C
VKITLDEVRYISELANLRLSDEDLRNYASEMEEILSYVAKLEELDTTGVEPMAQVLYPGGAADSTLREDEVRPSFDQELALRPAPMPGGGYFKVPKVIER